MQFSSVFCPLLFRPDKGMEQRAMLGEDWGGWREGGTGWWWCDGSGLTGPHQIERERERERERQKQRIDRGFHSTTTGPESRTGGGEGDRAWGRGRYQDYTLNYIAGRLSSPSLSAEYSSLLKKWLSNQRWTTLAI